MSRLLALIALPLVTVAVPATAQPVTAVRVAYHDLDLTTPAGRATLDRRLARAATQVCEREAPYPSLSPAFAVSICRGKLIRAFTPQRDHAIIASQAVQSPILAAR